MSNKSIQLLLPPETEELNEENFLKFYQTMFERQVIWVKRFLKNEPRPWTDDEILRDYKFTNVYRELDRNSQWLIKNVIMKETNPREMLWKMMFFRFFNCPETFEYISKVKPEWKRGLPNYKDFDNEELYRLVREYRATGNNPYTQAYLINSQACPGTTRDWCYCNKVIPTLHENINSILVILKIAKNPEEIIKKLLTLPAVAHFIAHEFYQDFTYVPRYSPNAINLMKFDQNDFTNVGPGAKVGIRLIFPNRKTPAEIKKGIYDLRELAKEMLAQFGDFPYLNWDRTNKQYYITPGVGDITLHAVEMWLCEFQKYWKMEVGKGKQRSKFQIKTKSL